MQFPDSEELGLTASNYYSASRTYSNDFALSFTLKEPVDVDILRKAVELSLPRYPYFSVRLERIEERFRLVHNDRPVPVGSKMPSCWGPETGEYLWFALADGCDMEFHCFHGLSDGGGLMHLARTALCRYLMLKHPDVLGPETLDLFQDGNECKDEEWCKPIPDEPFEDTDTYVSFGEGDVFIIPGDNLPDGKEYYKMLCVDESEYMKYAGSVNATPNLLTSLMMGRVAEKYRNGSKGKTVVGIAAQLKKFLGVPNTYHNILPLLNLEFPSDFTEMSTENAILELRTKRDDAIGDARMRGYINNLMYFNNMIDSKPTLAEKRGLSQYVVNGSINSTTFLVSYIRSEDLGPLDQYVERIQNHVDVRNMPWMMEIVAGCGVITFKSLQSKDNDGLFDGFCEELKKAGIKYTLLDKRPARYIGWNY